jgi:hypothetical protein
MIEPNETSGRVIGGTLAVTGRKSSRGAAVLLGSVAFALLGGIGLYAATAASAPKALTRTLLSLAVDWQESNALARPREPASPLARVSAAGAGTAAKAGSHVVGDEGFWLSKQDLHGNTATSVTVGDRISFAQGVHKRHSHGPGTAHDVTDTGPQAFEVVELKTLRDGTFVGPANALALGTSDASVLTLVVAREIEPALGTTPRTVRFIIEGSNAALPTTGTPARPTQTNSGAL